MREKVYNKAVELKNSTKYSTVSALVTIFLLFFAGIRTVEAYDFFLEIAETVFGVKAGAKHFEHDGLIISIGNDKIGEDTLITDVSCAVDCFCRQMGFCNICDDCYAIALEKFRSQKLLKNVLSARRWLSTSYEQKIESFESLIDDSIKYIRFNAYGDFYDLKSLQTAYNIACYMYKKYGIITYFYTHNKELEQYIIDNYENDIFYVCNFSYEVDGQKKTEAKDISEIKALLNDDNVIICTGECHYCPYCKMKHLEKTIVFVKHGHGQSAEKLLRKVLSKQEFESLINKKLLDYVNWRNSLQ